MNPSETPVDSVAVILRGDALHRKARRWSLIALTALLLTLPAIIFFPRLWSWVITLGSGAFLLAGAAWGLLMAVGPVTALVCALVALFLRVEAGFAPRSRRRHFGDAMAITGGLLVSFAPALAALYPPIKALITGEISFRGPGQFYTRTEDFYGYWQAVAYWFMGAATLALFAGLYWKAKWRSRVAADHA